ncbi:MAG TPA: limonene-1,2-epoxide hydrolase family protein [Sphingomicrobium sp.]|nr:limonene-1,2-epoxide hydrolase family protein [Sphingomicrobium sp.]
MSAEAVVRHFCAAWERRDLEAILYALSLDVEYQNVPASAMIGREAARSFIAPIVEQATAIEFTVNALAVSGDGCTVLTERVDKIHFGDRSVVIPLMGIFTVRAGLISLWRDYADSASVQAQFAALKG